MAAQSRSMEDWEVGAARFFTAAPQKYFTQVVRSLFKADQENRSATSFVAKWRQCRYRRKRARQYIRDRHWRYNSRRRLGGPLLASFKDPHTATTSRLEKVERLQGVAYDRKSDRNHEIGLIAEDVDPVIPEVVSRDPHTHQVQGVDYSRLTALLIEAVKTQQKEIEQLKARLEQLKFDGAR